MTVLRDEKAVRSLSRYFKVVKDELPAKFMIAKIPKANAARVKRDHK